MAIKGNNRSSADSIDGIYMGIGSTDSWIAFVTSNKALECRLGCKIVALSGLDGVYDGSKTDRQRQ